MTDELTQGVKDAQAKFDAGMGADGDASPYPMLKELRSEAPVHPGWREMGIFENPEEGQQIFSAYTFDAVKAVFTDNKTFSTRCYEAIVRPLQGPTILEMQEPEHQVYRKLHEFAFARSSMRRWESRAGTSTGGTHRRKAARCQAGRSGGRSLHADPGPGHRGADRPAGGRHSGVSPLGDRPVGLPLGHGQCAEGIRAVEAVLRRHPRRPAARHRATTW